jgi:kanamycin kinase
VPRATACRVLWDGGRVSGSGVPVPAAVAAAAGGQEVTLVWANEAGGLTFTAGEGAGRCFIKWAPSGSGLDLPAEARRLAWARQFHPVPQPVARGQDAAGSWLVTAALPGENAVSPRWKADPATAVTAIGEGLRVLHESLPAAQCPFSWSARQRLADARGQAAAGRLDRAAWHPCHQGLTSATALEQAAAIPPPDKLVVCHGDACAPNTLLDAYGIRPDPERTRYYRLLWDLSS